MYRQNCYCFSCFLKLYITWTTNVFHFQIRNCFPLKHIFPNTKLPFTGHIMQGLQGIKLHIQLISGNELVFDIRTPGKYHANQINSILHMHTNTTRTKSDYIPHEIQLVKSNQACKWSQTQIQQTTTIWFHSIRYTHELQLIKIICI